MARFEVNGIEGFEDKILKREAAATAAVPAMLKAGAAVLVDAQQAEIRSTFQSGRVTGDLASSIKATSVKKKDSTQYVEVYPQGTNRRGERNATTNTGDPICPRARGSQARMRRPRERYKRQCGRNGRNSKEAGPND